MIVGDSVVDYQLIRRNISTPELLVAAVCETVPVWCRFRKEIVDNQRYMYAVYLRNLASIPYTVKREAIAALIKGVNLTGLTSGFISIKDILDACDKRKLATMLEAYRDGRFDL